MENGHVENANPQLLIRVRATAKYAEVRIGRTAPIRGVCQFFGCVRQLACAFLRRGDQEPRQPCQENTIISLGRLYILTLSVTCVRRFRVDLLGWAGGELQIGVIKYNNLVEQSAGRI